MNSEYISNKFIYNTVLSMAGYKLHRIYATHQHWEWTDWGSETGTISYNWNWGPFIGAEDKRRFYVTLGVDIEPTPTRADEISTIVIGDFSVEDSSRTSSNLHLVDFVLQLAPSILCSYIRDIVTSLTTYSPSGVYYLSPFDPAKELSIFSFQNSVGAYALREDPELAARFGVAPYLLSDDYNETEQRPSGKRAKKRTAKNKAGPLADSVQARIEAL